MYMNQREYKADISKIAAHDFDPYDWRITSKIAYQNVRDASFFLLLMILFLFVVIIQFWRYFDFAFYSPSMVVVLMLMGIFHDLFKIKANWWPFLIPLTYDFRFLFVSLFHFHWSSADDDDVTTSGVTLDDVDKRVIFLNKPQPQKFSTNHISTAKYRWVLLCCVVYGGQMESYLQRV